MINPDELYHGVLGMKWGRHKARNISSKTGGKVKSKSKSTKAGNSKKLQVVAKKGADFIRNNKSAIMGVSLAVASVGAAQLAGPYASAALSSLANVKVISSTQTHNMYGLTGNRFYDGTFTTHR